MSILGQTGAPYQSARVRVLVGLACRALGDADSAKIELDAACQIFHQVGARPDVDQLRRADRLRPVDLSERTDSSEVQVLSLAAKGRANKEISSTLFISEHTVARHLQNIFTKLGVSSRTEAAAYAFKHSLV